MIGQLTGIVARTTPSVILDVNGVGYRIGVPVSTLERLPTDGTPVTLFTRLQVREDDLSLYGFLDEDELTVFELLLTVSGVGPKVALALLSSLGAAGLARSVSSEDVRALAKVPGIGAKTAQRLVLELKEKIFALGLSRKADDLAGGRQVVAKTGDAALVDDVVSALANLGYPKNDALRAAEASLADAHQNDVAPAFATLLRASLTRLSR